MRAERNRRALAAAEPDRAVASGGQLVRGASVNTVGQAVSILVQLATTAALARLLTPEDFGLVAMALPVIGLVQLFSEFGLSRALVQARSINQEMASGLFLVNLGLAGVGFLACLGLAPLLAALYGEPRVEALVAVFGAVPLLSALGVQNMALLRRGLRWGAHQACGIVGQILGGAVAVALAATTEIGYWALAVQWLVASAATTAAALVATGWLPSLVADFRPARDALRFGLNLAGAGFVHFLQTHAPNFLIGWHSGAVPLGFYTRAFNAIGMASRLLAPVNGSVLPVLSRLQDEPEPWRRMLLDLSGGMALLGASMAAVLVVEGAAIVRILYGPGWEPATAPLVWLAIGLFATGPALVGNAVCLSLGNSERVFRWLLFVGLPLRLAAIGVGLGHGIEGVAAGLAAVSIVTALPWLRYACRGTAIGWLEIARMTAPYTLSAALAAAALSLAAPWAEAAALWRLMLTGAAVLALQGAVFLLLPALDPEHLRLRRAALRRIGALSARLAKARRRA